MWLKGNILQAPNLIMPTVKGMCPECGVLSIYEAQESSFSACLPGSPTQIFLGNHESIYETSMGYDHLV